MPLSLSRLLLRTRAPFSWITRISVSTVAAYTASVAVHPQTNGITGALTALLIVQMTLHSTLRHCFDRIASVMLGIVVASLLSSVTGITWWSLGLVVAASVAAGQLLKVGPNLAEVPISAMLVLSAGATSGLAASDRLIETLIGALVGVVVNFSMPPGERSASAGVAVERYANSVADLLERTAGALDEPLQEANTSAWLAEARKLDTGVAEVDRILTHAGESRRMNLRALAKRDPSVALRDGLDSLEHVTVTVRTIFRGLNDLVVFAPSSDEVYGIEDRQMLAYAFREMASTLTSFGDLVHAQVHGAGIDERSKFDGDLAVLAGVHRSVAHYVRNQPITNEDVFELNVMLSASIGRVAREFSVEGRGWLANKGDYDRLAHHRALVATDKLRDMTLRRALRPTGSSSLKRRLQANKR